MILSPQRAHRGAAQASKRRAPAPQAVSSRVTPYEYAATFEITGIPGNLIQGVVNISVEAVFVAVAIGYGFEQDRGETIDILPAGGGSTTFLPGDTTFDRIPADALLTGFRVDPQFQSMVFEIDESTGRGGHLGSPRLRPFSDLPLPPGLSNNLFQKVQQPKEISFLFSMVDSSSGRELQDEPTHNLASLGISSGERPFRQLAQPLYFMPRSTIRLQIEERTEGVTGTLFIVLYGYKIYTSPGCPEPVVRSIHGPQACPTETIGNPSDRVIPFDYVTKFQFTGSEENLLEDEVSINVEGGYVVTALGYGLAAEDQGLPIDVPTNITSGTNFDLSAVRLRDLPLNALIDGFRVRPGLVRIAFQNNGALADKLPLDFAGSILESLNQPEDVSFRYAILDTGSGRELQNRPINNIAGLGIANGRRPFKKLVRPMIFLPRSTIRVSIEERFGRGVLYLVFQGYKILGSMQAGGRR